MSSFKNKSLATLSAAAFALTLSNSPSFANEDTAKAIAGIIALGAIGAAIAHDQHKNGHRQYTNHPKVHAEENAVGRCMYRVKNEVKNAGGYRANLDHVKSVNTAGSGALDVKMVVTGYYDFGHRTSDVNCTVHNNKVSKFSYHNAAADAAKRPTHDNAPTAGSNERAYYDDGCREGTRDAKSSMSSVYERYSDMYDSRFEPYFKQGYEVCWKHYR